MRILTALLCSAARVLAVLGMVLAASPAHAAPLQPMQSVSTCVVTATSTATNVAALMVTAGCYASQSAVPNGATILTNGAAGAAAVCIGADQNSTTSGGHCLPIGPGQVGGTQWSAFVGAGGVQIVTATTQTLIAQVGQ